MHRGWKILAWAASILVALPVLAVGALLAIGNLGGAGWIAGWVTSLSGGELVIRDLSGTFPTAMRASQLVLRDAKGPWARADDLRLDWSPLALFHGVLHIDRLDAERVALLRRPVPTGKSGGGSAGLPVGVEIDALRVGRIALSPAVAGQAASLSLDGSLRLASLERGRLALTARRLDTPGGSYAISGAVAPDSVTATVAIDEPAHGLIATLASLPDLGPLKLDASLQGARANEQARLALAAGPMTLDGHGTVDLASRRVDLTVTGAAPAMQPAPRIGWRAIRLDAHVQGSFAAPDANGHLQIDGLSAAGASARRLAADIEGNSGRIATTAELDDLTIPGSKPALLAGAPLKIRADVALNTPDRPVTITLSHPLIRADGRIALGAGRAGTLAVELPALAPLAAAAGLDLRGHARVDSRFSSADGETRLNATGTIAVDGGAPIAVHTLGNDAKIDLAVSEKDGAVRVERLALDGKAVRASVSGSRAASGAVDLAWTAALPALSAIAANVKGEMTAKGTVKGMPQDLAVIGDATIAAVFAKLPRQQIKIAMRLSGLPGAPSGTVDARGQLAGAPLRLAATVARAANGTLRVGVERGEWKSARLDGALTLPPGAAVPQGRLQLRFDRLADLQPLLGQDISGSMSARIDTQQAQGAAQAKIDMRAEGLRFAGTQLDRIAIGGTIDRLETDRILALTMTLDGLHAQGISGRAALTARGPVLKPALRLTATLHPPGKGAARISAEAKADIAGRTLRLASFQAAYRGQTARLLNPARISLANGLVIDNLRLGAGKAVVAISGRLSPALDLKASARHVGVALLSSFAKSGITAAGELAMDAELHGTPSSPSGTIRITGRGLRGWTGPDAVRADLDASARLHDGSAAIDATLAAGNAAKLTVKGEAPIGSGGTLSLSVAGGLDLALLDPFIAAEGRRVRGKAMLNLIATGTLAAPEIAGTAGLADVEVQDYVQGIHITDVTAEVAIADGIARIGRFTGRAGDGALSLSGTVDLRSPGMPVDITFVARKAKLPARDLVTAIIDAEIHLRGSAKQRLQVAGDVHVARADIQIPDALPKSVATLEVRRPGQEPPEPSGPAFVLGLDITVNAPEQIFVRGHGLDAEMGGNLRITGSTADPSVTGGFKLRHGSLDVAGQTLQFVSGSVGFDGKGLTGKLDPTLDFVAEKTNGNVTARIEITGYADDPKIELSSTPPLPQDEVLAHLLFARSVNQLSPIEIAQIGAALASLAGGGGGFSPLGEVRKGLGLDVLSVGGASGSADKSGGPGTGTTVEAGKYVANGVFVGSKQSVGGGTKAELKVDLTQHLKLETQLGAGGGGSVTGATPENDPGSSIGLTYEFEY